MSNAELWCEFDRVISDYLGDYLPDLVKKREELSRRILHLKSSAQFRPAGSSLKLLKTGLPQKAGNAGHDHLGRERREMRPVILLRIVSPGP